MTSGRGNRAVSSARHYRAAGGQHDGAQWDVFQVLPDQPQRDEIPVHHGMSGRRRWRGYSDREIERMTRGLRPRAAIASIVVMTQ